MTLKQFQPAQAEIVKFETKDIIAASSGVSIIDRPPDDGNDDMF
ncbi:MAG: hypothetical protein ACI3VX_08680 [Faecousia sp.]